MDRSSEIREAKLKAFLKSWEEGFKVKEGRAPKPQDVKHRPRLLRKYKEYNALKKSRGQHKRTPRIDYTPPAHSSSIGHASSFSASSTLAQNATMLDPTCIPNSPAKWVAGIGQTQPQRRGGARLRIPESPDIQTKGRNLHHMRKPGQMNAFQRSLSASSRPRQSLKTFVSARRYVLFCLFLCLVYFLPQWHWAHSGLFRDIIASAN
jgi:hypothetical protein